MRTEVPAVTAKLVVLTLVAASAALAPGAAHAQAEAGLPADVNPTSGTGSRSPPPTRPAVRPRPPMPSAPPARGPMSAGTPRRAVRSWSWPS